jgi:hypothetical protein
MILTRSPLGTLIAGCYGQKVFFVEKEEKMVKRYFLFFLLCVAVTGFIMCGAGCTGEEPKDVSKEKAVPAKEVKKATESEGAPSKETKEVTETKVLAAKEVKEASQEESTQKEEKKVVGKTEMPPAEILILSPLWKEHTRAGVAFTHENHEKKYKISCNECHHIYENGKNVWKKGMPVSRCEVCHNEETVKGETKLSPDAKKKNLKLAFHGNCQGCHRKLKKENSESKAPTICGKCHSKKE